MSRSNELVAVHVLSWNHEAYVKNCLESIVGQTYKDIFIVYLDNASTDNTFEVALAYLETCGVPFIAEKRKQPYSVTINANYNLSKAPGYKYFAIISSDDWMAPENIEKKLDLLSRSPDMGAVHSDLIYYYEDEDRYERIPKKLPDEPTFDALVKGNFINVPGVVLDQEKVVALGGFNEKVLIEDWDLWLRMSQRYEIGFVPEFLVYYRRHSSNASNYQSAKFLIALLEILDQYKGHKNYSIAKQQITYNIYRELTDAQPGLGNLWNTLKIQDGSRYRLNVLKHNLVKIFKGK